MSPLLLSALKSIGAGPWQTAFVIVATTFVAYFRIQEQRWLSRSKRVKAFNDLLPGDRWRRVSPLELHTDMIEAYGKTVEQTELAFMMTRSRCAYLLRDRLVATGYVRFKATCDGWESNEAGITADKLRRRGRIFEIVALISTAFALEFGLACMTKFDSIYLMPLGVFVVLTLTFFVLANQFDCASRVIDVDAKFPELVPMPPHLDAKPAAREVAPSNSPRRRQSKPRARKTVPGAGTDTLS